jgi:hypothetical protein
MMGLAFVSNGVALLDLGHNFNKFMRKLFRKNKTKPFIDTWFFDIGPN